MRLPAFLLLLLAPLPAAAQVLHHDAEIRVDPNLRRIEVTDTVTARDGAVTVQPPEGAPFTLTGRRTLRYTLTLPLLEPGGDGAMIGPLGAYLPAGGGWLATAAAPETFTITVTTPRPYVAVATGSPGADGRFASSRPGEGPSLFVGRYTVTERRVDGVTLRTYFDGSVPPELAGDYLDLSAEMIRRFSAEIGPYPYDAFHIVAAPLPVGLGFPGLTYISGRILPMPFIRAQSLPHEIVHNWWGNGLVPDYDSGNWAEGLTTFMADYRLADEDGRRRMRLEWLRDYAALPPERDTPVTAFRVKEHGASQVVGYNKSAFVFVMLEDLLGTETFNAGLQRFWQEHKHGRASWSDMRRAFEQASGSDLGGFFEQWLERPGAPALRLDTAEAVPDGDGWMVRVEVSQAEPAYALDIPMFIETSASREGAVAGVSARLPLDGTAAGMAVRVKERPLAVAVDPAHRLFRHLAEGEAPPILRDVTLAQRPALVITGGGDLADAARALAERLLEGEAQSMSPEQAAGHAGPLLLIGGGEQLAAALDRLQPRRAMPGGEASARVWAAERPDGATMVTVAAADAASLSALLRPLPHYGRQGWLLFDGSKLARKGDWPQYVSPLRRPLGAAAR